MMKKKTLVYKYFRKKEEKLYEISDYIGCMSEKNVDYIKAHNKHLEDKLHIFYNSIKIKAVAKEFKNKETITFIFGGNIGKPQYIEGLLQVINELKTFPTARFMIIGKGTEKYKVIEYIKDNTDNLQFYEYVDKNRYEEILKTVDVGIINLNPDFTIPNIPSKLLSYMNMQIPVVAFTDNNTDLKKILEQAKCGWWCNSSDVRGMIQTIKQICKDRNLIKQKGLSGYKYLKDNFNVENNVKQIEQFMNSERINNGNSE